MVAFHGPLCSVFHGPWPCPPPDIFYYALSIHCTLRGKEKKQLLQNYSFCGKIFWVKCKNVFKCVQALGWKGI